MAGKRTSRTTQPGRWATRNEESEQRMMRVATKRARAAKAMVTAMRVAGDKGKGHCVGNEGDMQ